MIFRRGKTEDRNPDRIITFSIGFHVTDGEGRPVDPDLLDAQTDALMEQLEGIESHRFHDLDVDAALGQGVVTFSVEILEPEVNSSLLLKELFSDIIPAIYSVGGAVPVEGFTPQIAESDSPVWYPEEPVLA